MRVELAVPGVIILTLGLLVMFDGAAADTGGARNPTGLSKKESDVVKTVVMRTVGWSRYYGRPVYRCRRFSSECYYYRSAHYVRHWSHSTWTNYENRPSETARVVAGPTARLDTQNARNVIYRGQKVTAYEVSGGFVRISSPGRSTRWVRADSLSAIRPDDLTTSHVSKKPQET